MAKQGEETMFRPRTKTDRLPAGPDEMMGTTEGSKAWIGILIAVVILAILVWRAFAIA